ncbi:MAG: hypothetical protein R3B82_27140 [Sandaracinaceae bacterium]
MEPIRIYEHELPPADDPDVVERAALFVAEARAAQRPARAVGVGIVSVVIGVVIWGELNRWTEFDMPWLLMAGTAVGLGVLMGLPYRKAGALFDRRWALLAGALGVLMALLGDLHAMALIQASLEDGPWLRALGRIDIVDWIAARQPIDWVVAGLGGAGAFVAARPPLDPRQLLMEARIAVHQEDLEAEAADEDAGLTPDEASR